MRYVSTRDNGDKVNAAQAIIKGISPSGGLYVPEIIPKIDAGMYPRLCNMDYIGRCAEITGLFLQEWTKSELMRIITHSYTFSKFSGSEIAPVKNLADGLYVLELFHGPTAAFKDMALQLLPNLLTASMRKTGDTRTVCILVATSGDTGKAALEGFKDVPGTKILVFYPKDGVSETQKLQMITQEGSNVGVCAVNGNFDDAQTGVKNIFLDKEIGQKAAAANVFLSSANSINWGRLLPQIVYYFSAYCDLVNKNEIKQGEKINVCVPTGNFGNILAGYYAYLMGLPVKRFICASNMNNVLTEFIQNGVYDRNRDFHATISPSMDILISSNVERLLYDLCGGDSAEVAGYMDSLAQTGKYELKTERHDKLRSLFTGSFCDENRTKTAISACREKFGYVCDTHTAVAFYCAGKYKTETGDDTKCLVVSTASPYKFSASVLGALDGNNHPDTPEAMDMLAAYTGGVVPKTLSSITDKQKRFTDCTDKDDMQRVVTEFINAGI